MNINTNNSSGMMNGMPPEIKNDRKIGPIIGVLIIVLIIIIVALYFFGQRLNTQSPLTPNNQTNNSEGIIRNEADMSTSTDVQSLQNDVDSQMKDVDYSF